MHWLFFALVLVATSVGTVGSADLTSVEREDCFIVYSTSGYFKMTKKPTKQFRRIKKFLLLKGFDAADAERTAARYCDKSKSIINIHEKTLPDVWACMTVVESRGDSTAVSSEGAQGKLQVMPSWKRKPGFEFYRGKYSHLDDDKNYRAAQKVLLDCLTDNRSDLWKSVERYCGTGPDARDYVRKVKRLYLELRNVQVG